MLGILLLAGLMGRWLGESDLANLMYMVLRRKSRSPESAQVKQEEVPSAAQPLTKGASSGSGF
ncbi:MAG: hypothetical protein JOZ43_06220 [Acidobacteriales bacterium]|nr:hypothetical protein [Terriglobales bacterium]